jgi:hypothetical protein
MSGHNDHQLPGPIGDGGSWLTWGNLFKLVGILALIAMGVLTDTLRFGKQVGTDMAPLVNQAKDHLVALNPGAPGFGIVINGVEHVWWGQQQPGKDWQEIVGTTYGNGSNSSNSGNGGNTSPDSSGYTAPPPAAGEDPATVYAKYKTQFIGLVGGQPDIPDFTQLTSGNVKAARQTLALMRATGVDLVTVTSWSDQLEQAVTSHFEDCFKNKDLSCVRDWNDLVSKVVSDPPGLTEWLTAVLSDNSKVNEIVNAATNTNAGDVLSNLLRDQYTKAFADRVTTGCNALANGQITALNVQWCYASKTVHLWIVQSNALGNWVPSAVGGKSDVFDDNDTLQIVYNGAVVDVPYAEAINAIPGISFADHDKDYAFPASPSLWDATSNPWVPGQPIP